MTFPPSKIIVLKNIKTLETCVNGYKLLHNFAADTCTYALLAACTQTLCAKPPQFPHVNELSPKARETTNTGTTPHALLCGAFNTKITKEKSEKEVPKWTKHCKEM